MSAPNKEGLGRRLQINLKNQRGTERLCNVEELKNKSLRGKMLSETATQHRPK